MLVDSAILIKSEDGGHGFIDTMFRMIFGMNAADGSSFLGDFQGYDKLKASGWMLTDMIGTIDGLMNKVFAPAVIAFLTVIFAINFFKVLISLDGSDSSGGVQKMVQVAIKYAILVILAKNAIMIVKAIAAIIDRFVTKAYDGSYNNSGSVDNYPEIQSAIDGLGTIDSVILVIVLLIPFLIAAAANLAVYVIVVLRLAEFIMMGAAAPIPVAFLGDEDTKSIGIGYLKKMFSVGLQAVLLLFISSVINAIPIGSTSDFSGVTSDNLVSLASSHFLTFLILPIIQLVLVFSTGKISKAIMGE